VTKKRYDNLRDQFDQLGTDEKLQFAVEAIIRTVGDVASKAADVASREDAVQTVVASVKKMAEDIHSSFQPKTKKRRRRPQTKKKS